MSVRNLYLGRNGDGDGNKAARERLLTIEEGNEDDESDWVEVLEEIVGCAVECHFACLRDEVVPDLDPAYEVEGEEKEDLSWLLVSSVIY